MLYVSSFLLFFWSLLLWCNKRENTLAIQVYNLVLFDIKLLIDTNTFNYSFEKKKKREKILQGYSPTDTFINLY